MDMTGDVRPARPSPLFPRGGGGEGALFGVMAIMSFLACLTLGLALGAARLADAWERGLSGQATVQIVEAEGIKMEAQLAAAMQVLNETPGVAAARALTREESAALLKPWLGDADLDIVPVPTLIAVTLDPAIPIDGEALKTRLREAAPGASFDDHSRWNDGLTAASATIGGAAYTVLALIAIAAGASAVFAARAALLAHRNVVDVLHLSGARPAFIAREVQWRFLRLGGEAGLAGLAAAAIFVAVSATLMSGQEAYFLPSLTPHLGDLFWFLMVPAGAAVIAMLTARIAVRNFLNEAG